MPKLTRRKIRKTGGGKKEGARDRGWKSYNVSTDEGFQFWKQWGLCVKKKHEKVGSPLQNKIKKERY